MKKLSVILMALIICNACKKDTPSQVKITGVYSGSFERKLGDSGIKRGVSITFSSNTLTGNSDSTNYPTICNGTYTIKGDSINFQNLCVLPANFDWTYVLSGTYSLEISGDSLIFGRAYGDIIYQADIYKLKKQ